LNALRRVTKDAGGIYVDSRLRKLEQASPSERARFLWASLEAIERDPDAFIEFLDRCIDASLGILELYGVDAEGNVWRSVRDGTGSREAAGRRWVQDASASAYGDPPLHYPDPDGFERLLRQDPFEQLERYYGPRVGGRRTP